MSAHPDAARQAGPESAAWDVLLGMAGRRGGVPPTAAPGLLRRQGNSWQIHPDAPASCRDLLSLYLPLVAAGPDACWVVGHLGQSLDGSIATRNGESCVGGYSVTGHENMRHLHRMRALCDAVLVGAGTVAHDDPRLTTRLVPGPSPVRVVLDSRRRLAAHHRVFQDGAAPTLLCVGKEQTAPPPGHATLLPLPSGADGLRLDLLVAALARRGLRRLFVEGGGVTVSRFVAAGRLSRLQIAVAPLVIGQGRRGLQLPPTACLADALRLRPRIYRMGADLLYDVALDAGHEDGTTSRPRAFEGLERLV